MRRDGDRQLAGEPHGLVEDGFERDGVRVFHGEPRILAGRAKQSNDGRHPLSRPGVESRQRPRNQTVDRQPATVDSLREDRHRCPRAAQRADRHRHLHGRDRPGPGGPARPVRGTLRPAAVSGHFQRRRPVQPAHRSPPLRDRLAALDPAPADRPLGGRGPRVRPDDRAGPGRRPLRVDRPRPDAPDPPRVARRAHRVGFVPLWDRTVERAARFLCVSRDHGRRPRGALPRDRRPRARRPRTAWIREFFFPADDPAARLRTRQAYADGRPFLLYLGTLEPRKNVEALVVACERLWGRRRSRPDLVLAGGAGWKTGGLHRRIAGSPFRDKIHVAGYAARDAARELYRAAEAFVYPVAGRGLRSPGPRGDGLRDSGRGLDGRRAASRSAGDAALYAPPRDVEALVPPDRTGSGGPARCGRPSRRPARRGPRSSRGTPAVAEDGGGPRRSRRRRIRELRRRAAGRDRRAQAEGLRDRLLHPQPPRRDRPEAGVRRPIDSASTCARGPGRGPAASRQLRARRGELARLLRLGADPLFVAAAARPARPLPRHPLRHPPAGPGARGRDDSRHHPRALSAVSAQPRRAPLRARA